MNTPVQMDESGWYRRRGKRILDVTATTGLLLVLSPVMLLTAACVLIVLGRPILFRQERAGLGGRSFTLIKFRSMLHEAGPEAELSDELRITRLGKFLRKTSLDELPELLNVIRGEMSLVGPRPLLPRYNERYSPEQARRLAVRPGITGWAQIHGRNDTTWGERFKRDVWYVDHLSPIVDIRILLQTVPVVLVGRGVTPRDEPFMPEFEGEASEEVSNGAMST